MCPRAVDVPATRYSKTTEFSNLSHDLTTVQEIVGEQRKRVPDIRGWVNFPIINQSGNDLDVCTDACKHCGIWTPLADRVSAIREAIQECLLPNFDIHYARVACLGPRDVLRPHRDTNPGSRLLIALNEQANHFRHVFGTECVCMRPGDIWGVNGSICHGAANISHHGMRVLLVLDVSPKQMDNSHWFLKDWRIPDCARIRRQLWSNNIQGKVRIAAQKILNRRGLEVMQTFWYFMPFLFAMDAAQVYRELHRFYAKMGELFPTEDVWSDLAKDLRHPRLPFEVEIEDSTTSELRYPFCKLKTANA